MAQVLPGWLKGRCGITSFLIFSCLLKPVVLNAAEDAHAHAPLATSNSMTFDQVFAGALEYSPEALETPVREQQAQAYSSTGKSFIAGRPSLQLSYYDDGIIDSTGLTEMEYGVQLPLWRPGQRQDTRLLLRVSAGLFQRMLRDRSLLLRAATSGAPWP